jgi:hypothetical protein
MFKIRRCTRNTNKARGTRTTAAADGNHWRNIDQQKLD